MEKRRRIGKWPTSSASSYLVLDDDVWFEIIKRLPLKDILRSRCVCRSWYSLVASSLFVKEHLHSKLHKLEDGRNGDLLLFREGSGNPDQKQAKLSLLDPKTLSSKSGFFYCPIAPVNNPHFRVVGSIHGIICLLDDNSYHPAKNVTLLWNPSVHRYIRLPQPPSHKIHTHDKRHWHYTFPRFTFNPINKDYCVVRVMYCYANLSATELAEPPVIEFYSFGKHEWKTVSSSNILPYVIVEDSCSQYRSSIDGAVCWIGWKKGSSVIFSFSAVDYELKTLPLPDQLGCSLNPLRSRVVEFRGFLSVMEVIKTMVMGVELALNIWSCIDNKSDRYWCKMVSINTAVDGLRVRERSALMRVYEVTDDECVIGGRVRKYGNLQLVSFRPKTNQIDGFKEYACEGKALFMSSYMQSLLLLDDKSRAVSYDPTTIPRSYEIGSSGAMLMDLGLIYDVRLKKKMPRRRIVQV